MLTDVDQQADPEAEQKTAANKLAGAFACLEAAAKMAGSTSSSSYEADDTLASQVEKLRESLGGFNLPFSSERETLAYGILGKDTAASQKAQTE